MASGTGAWVVFTVRALLFLGTPSMAAAEPGPPARALVPELSLLEQHTFTGEVRDILLVGGEVWAATGGGLAIHRRSDGAHLRTLTSADGMPGNSLRSLLRVDATHVLAGGDFAAALVAVASPHVIVKLGCQAGCMTFDPVYAAALGPDAVWLLRHQGGLERWVHEGRTWARKTTGEPGMWRALVGGAAPVLGGVDGRLVFVDGAGKRTASFALGTPVAALQGREGDVVVATGEKLLQARADGVRTLVVQSAGESRSPAATALSLPAGDGTILVGTARGELLGLRGDTLMRLAEGLRGRITAVVADGGRVWLGLGRSGLHVLDAGAPTSSLRPGGEICDNHVVSVARFADVIVAGTFDQGACYLRKGAWHLLDDLPSPMVHGLGSDGQDLYVATSNSLSRYDRRLRPRPIGKGDPPVLRWLSTAGTTAIAPTGGHGLAVTSGYGLLELRRDGKKLSAVLTSHRAGAPRKLTAVAAASGQIWMASESEGVKSLGAEGRPARHLQDPEDLPENWVTSLAATGPDALWVGTCQNGAARLRGGERRFVDRRNLLPDNMVVALAADERGAFIGTLGGLSFASAESDAGRTFGWDAGLPDPRSAGLTLDGGELWLGTEAGLARYRVLY